MKMSSSSCDEERPFASEYKHISSTKRQRTWREKASTLLLILNVIIMLGAVVCFSTLMATNRLKRPERIDCFDDTLLDPPIIWESRTFRSTVDERQGLVTDHVTPSGPVIAAEWGSLLDVGEIRLSEAEAARLSQGTARLYGGEDGYAGVLEVFHQLHCLNRIRKKFFNVSGPIDDPGDSEHLSHWHDKHYFDYLRQTLLCHADVSVMTVGWNEKQEAYTANFAVTKQCRNFEAIHNWAKNREAKFKPPGDTHPGRIESRNQNQL